MCLSDDLRKFWGEGPDRKVAVLGVGRSIRGDEAGGLIVADKLSKLGTGALVIRAEDRPENWTKEIVAFAPTHMLFVLATPFGGAPGEMKLVSFKEHAKTSLHESPLTTLDHYIGSQMRVDVKLLLIEPRAVVGEVTATMREAAKRVAGEIASALC